MKKKALLKLCIVTVIVIIISIGIVMFPKQLNKINIFKNPKKQVDNSITVIDVTNLVIGEDVPHDHNLKSMYNQNQHWKECTICGYKEEIMNHTYTTTWALGYESCESRNSYTNTCSCGYTETGYKPCVWDGKTYLWDDFYHIRKCSICQKEIQNSYYLYYYENGTIYSADTDNSNFLTAKGYHYCYKSNGERLTCNNLGTCIACGRTFTTARHAVRAVELKNNILGPSTKISCTICNINLGTVSNQIRVDEKSPAEYTIISKIKLLEGIKGTGINPAFGFDDCFEIDTAECTEYNDTGNEFTVEHKIKFKNTVKTKHFLHLAYEIEAAGERFALLNYLKNGTGNYLTDSVLSPDLEPPTINNINSQQLKEWNRIIPITISGTETYCDTVTIEIIDNEGNIIYKGGGNVTNGQYSITCIPELESNLEGRTFKAIVTDSCENTVEKDFTISKIDSIPPKITSKESVSDEWAKEKEFTATAADTGIGEVQIGFNSQYEYQTATLENNTYSRNYKFIGDVYSPKQAIIMYKDGLGNISSKEVTINKIDNTAPSITNATVHNNKLLIESNDIKEGVGEGSGVTKYKYITSIEKQENPIISETATEVNKRDDVIISNIYEVKYIYVIAEDAVRKCKQYL